MEDRTYDPPSPPQERGSLRLPDAQRTDVSGSRDSDPMLEILQFERDWESRTGSKTAAIRDTFNVSPTRYYQWLHQAIDTPEALQQDPVLVHRLQRLREDRARSRAQREFRRA